jgi:flagellar biogenesis protein FliO
VPFKQTGESEDWLVYQAAGAFLLACAAAYGIAFSLKRLRPQLPGKAARHTRLQVLETRRLTQRSTLFRIDFDGQELLIAESGQSLTVLASSQPADAARYLEPGETR